VNFNNQISGLDDLLSGVDFIYSGDVIKSNQMKWVKNLPHQSFSSKFLLEIINDIYEWSINKMIENADKLIIHNNFNKPISIDILSSINLGINPSIMFYSNNIFSKLNIQLSFPFSGLNNTSYLDDHFQLKFEYLINNREISSYYSPIIRDNIDDSSIYFVDNPIQSMVWSLQNMTYDIKDNNHIIEMPIYDCSYKAVHVRIVDTQKIREMKINSILE